MSAKDTVFDILRAPVAEVLGRVGITGKRNKDWFNLDYCPWCNHGTKGGSAKSNLNRQCGVHETHGSKGLLHAVKCFHPHDSPTGEENPHYAKFLAAAGVLTEDDVALAQRAKVPSFVANPSPVRVVSSAAKSDLGRMNEENNAKARRRLYSNQDAMTWLTKVRGYTSETIQRFKMGLSEPYLDKSTGEVIHAKALAAPLLGADGNFYKKYVNYVIPGLTEKHGRVVDGSQKGDLKPWSPGIARAYYNEDTRQKQWLFVCDGLKDLWALDQLIRGTSLAKRLALVSSTNGGGVKPSEWEQAEYWDRFELVFAGHDNDKADPLTGLRAGDDHAKKIAEVAGRDVRRVTPPGVKDWNDWILAGHTIEQFEQLLESSEVISIVDAIVKDDGKSFGRFAAQPVSVVGEYHNGFLYAAVRTLMRMPDEATGEVLEQYHTVVIRSDRTKHTTKVMPHPKGTPSHEVVRRLYPDGALLSEIPQANPHMTWEWASIEAWLERKDRKIPLKDLLRSIQNHLRGSVWLPYESDFSILTCAVAASYVQEIFDAVPLLLVTGHKGSGKSELGDALRTLGANAQQPLSIVSPAALARHVHKTRGMIVIDDLEKIGGTGKNDPQFDDMVQTLKLSYKKSTARKQIVVKENGQELLRDFNFFGIKVINNTRGTDDILGSRMLTIATRGMPAHVQLDKSLKMQPEALRELRNQLHTWAFNNVNLVVEAYQTIFPNKTGRQDEIEAPLRVIAALSGDETLNESLEKALARQKSAVVDSFSPEQVLREALESIFRRSIERDGVIPTVVTVTQVMYEAALLVDVNYGKDSTTSLAQIEKPEWVGRTLMQAYANPDAPQQRTTMFGKTLRAYTLSEEFIGTTLKKMSAEAPMIFENDVPRSADFKMFCKACPECPYRSKCDIQSHRYPDAKK